MERELGKRGIKKQECEIFINSGSPSDYKTLRDKLQEKGFRIRESKLESSIAKRRITYHPQTNRLLVVY